jgi:transcriptional regulator with PAS, ATPase and Fis domain
LGLFQLAHGGTLFLDEIGDMEFDLQAKLLRILETGEFMRIGGTKPIKVDVRIVSATNKDLEKLIRETKYREDLFYRLNVIALRIPPLRARTEDIPLLVEYYLDRLGSKMNRGIALSDEALTILKQYHYPGNVRELFNILEFAANTCEGPTIMPSDLPIFSRIKYQPEPQGILTDARRTSEKDAIQAALKNFGTSVEGKRRAAQHLGISLATLYNKIRQYGI